MFFGGFQIRTSKLGLCSHCYPSHPLLTPIHPCLYCKINLSTFSNAHSNNTRDNNADDPVSQLNIKQPYSAKINHDELQLILFCSKHPFAAGLDIDLLLAGKNAVCNEDQQYKNK